MRPLLGHILGFPLEEMLISVIGLSIGAVTAAVAMRLRAAREALRRPDPGAGDL